MDGPSTKRDAEHVKGLAIAHYLLGGLSALSAIPFIAFSKTVSQLVEVAGEGLPSVLEDYTDDLGLEVQNGAELDELGNATLGLAQEIGSTASALAITGIVLCLLTAAGYCWVGNRLRKHERWSICYLTGWFECLAFPFGTVVGVFTVLVLSRPGVKRLFGLD